MNSTSPSSGATQRLAAKPTVGRPPSARSPYTGGARSALDFLAGESGMAARMRTFDWANSSLGPPHTWPRALRGAVRTMLNTGHAAHIFWGEDRAFLYNDGFRASIGPLAEPHLGRPGQEAAAQIWDVLGPQIDQIMGGGPPSWHENQLIPMERDGRVEDIYWTYSYGPIDDPESPGGIGGVLAIGSMTTTTVVAEQRMAAQVERHWALFQQAPGFIAMLQGPEHRFEFANAAYVRLAGGRELVGRTVAEALPDSVELGFIDLLDLIFRTGETHKDKGFRFVMRATPDEPAVERYLDIIHQPITDAAGRITGICVQGNDVTDLTLAIRLQTQSAP